jgi:hypothetical protein
MYIEFSLSPCSLQCSTFGNTQAQATQNDSKQEKKEKKILPHLFTPTHRRLARRP